MDGENSSDSAFKIKGRDNSGSSTGRRQTAPEVTFLEISEEVLKFIAEDAQYAQDTFTGDDVESEISLSDITENAEGEEEEEVQVETQEERLSRALQTWRPMTEIRTLRPREIHPREPIFSGRLGRDPKLKRTDSTESIQTQLSLLSCSTIAPRRKVQPIRRRRTRRKEKPAEQEDQQPGAWNSPWVALANKKTREFDRYMRSQAATTIAFTTGIIDSDESEAWALMTEEERAMLMHCGRKKGIKYAEEGAELKKSGSTTNILADLAKTPKRRQSAGADKPHGPPLDFQEIRQQMLAAQRQAQRSKRQARLRSLPRSSSRHSISSISSNDPFGSPSPRTKSSTLDNEAPEEKVQLWKGDSQILEIDLRRGLSSKVKDKIRTTTAALERVTGQGESNDQHLLPGNLEEYPQLIEEDFGVLPKIPQKVRISPELSDVIKADIKVRMGRPRYHEIRMTDLQMWNKGQSLDRAYRNLKVFNWLHSLREDEFVKDVHPQIQDTLPGDREYTGAMIHINAVDEPKVKPLYERLKKEYVVM